ncbi:NUDIX hydrolase [Candidatus Babeliales bacterium]|nr:NUDIX hydrolase [Candidatus Babeliales bacterium]
MHRQNLINLLNNYHPADQAELSFKQRMLDFIHANPDCFERSLAQGHITASCWLQSKDGSKALLLHHMKLNNWFQLGGHCDGDSDVLAVAIKEAQEESGIMGIEPVSISIFDIDIHTIPANPKEAEHDHYDVRFLLRVTTDESIVQNRESKELRWIGKNIQELPTQNPSVVRMFMKWLAV